MGIGDAYQHTLTPPDPKTYAEQPEDAYILIIPYGKATTNVNLSIRQCVPAQDFTKTLDLYSEGPYNSDIP